MATAKPENIEYSNRLKFGTTFQYTVSDHSVEDVMSPNYFHVISQRYLNAGDEIRISVLDAKNKCWHKARVEVVSLTKSETLVEVVEPWRTGGVAQKVKTTRKAA